MNSFHESSDSIHPFNESSDSINSFHESSFNADQPSLSRQGSHSLGSSEAGAPTAAEELAEARIDIKALRWLRRTQRLQMQRLELDQQKVVGGLLGVVKESQVEQARQAQQAEEMRRSLAELRAYPDTWQMAQPERPEHGRFELTADSREFQDVAANFMRTMQAGVRIVSIERVQNISLWQSYVVK